MEESSKLLLKKARSLPALPGVYLMKDRQKNIIYIGKAKVLPNRVSSYFLNSKKHAPKIAKMVSLVCDFDFIITSSEFEALILECSLIKQNQPKYNTLLRDDKGYSFIEVGCLKTAWNKITAVKNKAKPGANYIGPFISGAAVTSLVETVNLAFGLPTCKKQLIKAKYYRPCLNYYINRCCAPCAHKVSETEYDTRLKNAIKTIKKGKKHIILELTKEMRAAAQNLDFEKAASLRDTINLIKKLQDEQHVILDSRSFCDTFAFFLQKNKTYAAALTFEAGHLTQSQNLTISGEFDEQTVCHALVQYYSAKHTPPEFVVLAQEFEDIHLAYEFLKQKNPNFSGIITLQEKTIYQGEQQQKLTAKAQKNYQAIYDLALKNAKQGALHKPAPSPTQKLQNLLGLPKEPEIIEVFDISNFSDSIIVGSMVTFRNGAPSKNEYRKFKIKSLTHQNDYGSMREMLLRRFRNNLEQKKGFEQTPDLILIDGGKQHLRVAHEVLLELNLNLAVASLVKDQHHKTRAVVFEGREIKIEDDELFNFFAMMQDEAHRFAITFARNTHTKRSLKE